MQSQRIASAYLEIGVNENALKQGLARSKQTATSGMADIAKGLSAAFAGFGIQSFINWGVDEAASVESALVAFEVMTKSATRAKELFEELRGMRDVVPIGFSDMANIAKRLLSFGVDVDKVSTIIKQMGDITGGNVEKMQMMALAFGQATGKTRLMGQETLQMVEQGFNPLVEMARTSGKTVQQLTKDMENGAISIDMVEAAFKSATSEGGLFFGSLEKQSATYNGRLAIMKSRWTDVARTIGEVVKPAKQALINTMIVLMDAFLGLNPMLQTTLSTMVALTPAILAVVAALKLLRAAGISAAVAMRTLLISTGVGILVALLGFVIAKFMDLFDAIQHAEGGTNKFSKGLEKLAYAWEVFADAMKLVFDSLGPLGEQFGAIMGTLKGSFEFFKNGFIDGLAAMFDAMAEFVLDSAEWFSVFVNGFGHVTNALLAAWDYTWSFMGDIVKNFLSGVMSSFAAFALFVGDVFSKIPEAIAAIFSGDGFGFESVMGAAIDEAVAKFAARQAAAFAKLATPSAETTEASIRLQREIAALNNAKKALEDKRKEREKEKEKEKQKEKESDKPKPTKPAAAKDSIKFGFIGLEEFNREIQDMFLKEGEKSKDDKLIDLGQLQADIQEKQLKAEEQQLAALQNAQVIKVAK